VPAPAARNDPVLAPVSPNLEEQAKFYDTWNANWRTGNFLEVDVEANARGSSVLAHLESLSLDRPRIIEVGCGTGWLTERLANFGSITAIDLSPKAIHIAESRNLDIEFIAGDFLHTHFPSPGFDVAICVETITSVPDQPLFLNKLASLILPGGYLILTAVNTFVYHRRSDVRAPEPGQIRRWLSRKDLHRLVDPHFHILKSTTVLPRGDRGILRLVNSTKLNRLVSLVLSHTTLRTIKESLGLGHCRVILARRRK
jgi:2-polyprenyl-3-methyl-5-hydroxy-6-metoxy-1,4-benzoquinol methylase